MRKFGITKTNLELLTKHVSKVLKKYRYHVITGVFCAGTSVAISQPSKKKAEKKAYKNGFADASEIYEKKFKLQTEEFLAKEKSYEHNKKEYDDLVSEYEKEIDKLEKKVQKTEDELRELKLLTDNKAKLLRMKIAV
ncbi:hypothetical protein AALC16_15420 [Lachnospiraceae bacterium 29-91]